LKTTEKFFRDREGEEERIRAAPEVTTENGLPMEEEIDRDPNKARSSGEITLIRMSKWGM